VGTGFAEQVLESLQLVYLNFPDYLGIGAKL
jgi:hypothetical protein